EQAETELRQAVKQDPRHYDCLYSLGFVLARLGKLEDARDYLEQAKQLNPGSEDVRYQLASVLTKLKETDSAKREFQEFEERKKQSQQENVAGTTGSKANKLLEDGDAQGAAQLYREALKLDPNNAKTYYNLGLALNKLGDQLGERRALEAAVRLDPNFVFARNQLG